MVRHDRVIGGTVKRTDDTGWYYLSPLVFLVIGISQLFDPERRTFGMIAVAVSLVALVTLTILTLRRARKTDE
jgi:TRAP-type uncharacterized transport system fused permease subunit